MQAALSDRGAARSALVEEIKNETFAAIPANAGANVQITGDDDKDSKKITVSKIAPAGK